MKKAEIRNKVTALLDKWEESKELSLSKKWRHFLIKQVSISNPHTTDAVEEAFHETLCNAEDLLLTLDSQPANTPVRYGHPRRKLYSTGPRIQFLEFVTRDWLTFQHMKARSFEGHNRVSWKKLSEKWNKEFPYDTRSPTAMRKRFYELAKDTVLIDEFFSYTLRKLKELWDMVEATKPAAMERYLERHRQRQQYINEGKPVPLNLRTFYRVDDPSPFSIAKRES